MKKSNAGDSAGFTLIEVAMVITIISALASIALPHYASYQEKARSAACLSERRTTQNLIAQYYLDDSTADLESLSQLVEGGYVASEPRCPHGGTWILLPPAAAGTDYPSVFCSLHSAPTVSEVAETMPEQSGQDDSTSSKGPSPEDKGKKKGWEKKGK